MSDLIELIETITPQKLAALRVLQTWRVKLIRGRWVVCGQAKANRDAFSWLMFQGLTRAYYKPTIPEMHITGLGHQLLAVKSKTAKIAAPSHQEQAA